MSSKDIIKHLQSALELSIDLFLQSFNFILNNLKEKKIDFSMEEKYSFLNIVSKYSIAANDISSLNVLKKTMNLLNSSEEGSSPAKVIQSNVLEKISKNPENIFQSGSGLNKSFECLSKKSTFYKKFNVEGVKMVFRLKDFSEEEKNPLQVLEKAFDDIIKDVTRDSLPGSKMSFSIALPNSPQIKPIWSSLRPVSEIDGKYITALISNVNQSNATFLADDVLQMNADIINFPFGGGKIDPRNVSENEALIRKTSVVDVGKNGSIDCLPRSICYGMQMTLNDFDHVTVMNSLDKFVKQLCKKANVIPSEKGYNIQDLYKFQKCLNDYQIIVFDDLKDSSSILFKLPLEKNNIKKVYLFYSRNSQHYFVIKSPTGFFNKKYLCSFCDKLMATQLHKCEIKCSYCNSFPPCKFVDKLKTCNTCNRTFRGEACFDNHLQNKIKNKTLCNIFKICKLCHKFLVLDKRKFEEHICNEFFCTLCSKIVTSDHLCYIKPYKGKSEQKFLMIFFDCESTQNTVLEGNDSSYLHIVNLIVAQQICYNCYENVDMAEKCEVCGDRQHIFEYDNKTSVVKRFLDYCLKPRSFVSSVFCIAHNLQGYDGHFLINELTARKLKIEPIMNGTKIMKLSCGQVRFIDSLNFLAIPLAKFPQVFDIKNYEKGYYPYYFNTTENITYIGKYPPPEMYGCNTMKVKEREDFLKWYDSASLGVFDNKREMIKYCLNDVCILRLGCIRFMTEFLSVTQINPFVESLTIASACMLVFRKNYLKKNTLGIMPATGYYKSQNQSYIASKWLAWESLKTKEELLSVNNKGEVRLEKSGLLVDGYISSTKTVYEFFGCYYHGCKECFKIQETNENSNRKIETLDQRFESTLRRIDTIKRSGYKLVYMWECEFKKFLKDNPSVNIKLTEYVKNIALPLNPRKAVFGGRTEVFRLHYKVQKNEAIRYLDFTSLYPYINKYSPYPIGHPEIFRNDNIPSLSEILSMHGFMLCSVVPPTDLFLPVLPFKSNSKLYFALCKKCAEEYKMLECHHTEEERQITGTWVIPEISLAVKKGYKIKKIFEVWKYDYTMYDPKTKSGGLFTEYVNTFLKIKQEASGWSGKYASEKEKDNFLKRYQIKEDIILDKELIRSNPGKRSTAKICLNSFWGKFAQKEDRTFTKVVHNFKDFINFIQSPGIEICSLLPINDDTIWLTWKYIHESLNSLPHVNIPIAAYTTAFARLKLYEALEKVGKAILYCDTDSILFVENKTNPFPFEISDFLGDLTNEIECFGPGSYISEFVSTGPKTYSLKIETSEGTEYITKCKGISINFDSCKVVNFERLKSMIQSDVEKEDFCVKNDRKIKRKQPGVIISSVQKKHLSFTFDKRVVEDEYFSYPYGFKKPRIVH